MDMQPSTYLFDYGSLDLIRFRSYDRSWKLYASCPATLVKTDSDKQAYGRMMRLINPLGISCSKYNNPQQPDPMPDDANTERDTPDQYSDN